MWIYLTEHFSEMIEFLVGYRKMTIREVVLKEQCMGVDPVFQRENMEDSDREGLITIDRDMEYSRRARFRFRRHWTAAQGFLPCDRVKTLNLIWRLGDSGEITADRI